VNAVQPDMMRHLQQLQRRAAQLRQLARDLAAATPRRADGADATGSARIVLGADALPIEIGVGDGWRRRLAPAGLGAAVLDANRDAVQRAMQAWTDELDHGRWWSRRADLDEAAGEGTDPVALGPPEPPHGQARDSSELAELVLAALQDAQQPTVAPASDEGTDDRRHVVVQVGPGGLTSCVIDPDWAASRDGTTISAALSSAMQRAKAKRPLTSPPGVESDNLVADALATLASLAMPPIIPGGDR
jgi:hypothetical protein